MNDKHQNFCQSASGAVFSSCRNWRYALWRNWEQGSGRVLFIGLNPSKADEHHNDPTIRRCMGFARDWGYRGMVVGNLYAYCATRPADLFDAPDPEGPENGKYLDLLTGLADMSICCWGNHGKSRQLEMPLLDGDTPLHTLKFNQSGAPTHPLYLPRGLMPVLWIDGPGS